AFCQFSSAFSGQVGAALTNISKLFADFLNTDLNFLIHHRCRFIGEHISSHRDITKRNCIILHDCVSFLKISLATPKESCRARAPAVLGVPFFTAQAN
ncbi:MAG: hypothetical protein ACLTLX_12730, partial [Ruthenibacterium lactatiformans]